MQARLSRFTVISMIAKEGLLLPLLVLQYSILLNSAVLAGWLPRYQLYTLYQHFKKGTFIPPENAISGIPLSLSLPLWEGHLCLQPEYEADSEGEQTAVLHASRQSLLEAKRSTMNTHQRRDGHKLKSLVSYSVCVARVWFPGPSVWIGPGSRSGGAYNCYLWYRYSLVPRSFHVAGL